MTLEQQRDYVKILRKAYLKTARVCGMLSKPERAMLGVLHEEWMKLLEMEADDA